MALWGSSVRSVRLHQNLASAVLLEPFLLSLNEGRVGSGGGDKLSQFIGMDYWPTAIRVRMYTLMCDSGGGVAAFIKIIDGRISNFPSPRITMVLPFESIQILRQRRWAAEKRPLRTQRVRSVNLAGGGLRRRQYLSHSRGRGFRRSTGVGDVGHTLLYAPYLFHLIAFGRRATTCLSLVTKPQVL